MVSAIVLSPMCAFTCVRLSAVSELKLIRCTDKQQRDSLYILIRDLLTQAVFMPITAIITEPNWINEQLVDLLESNDTVHNLQLNHPLAGSSPAIKLNDKKSTLKVSDPLDTIRRASSVSVERPSSASPKHIGQVDVIKSDMKRSLSADLFLDHLSESIV